METILQTPLAIFNVGSPELIIVLLIILLLFGAKKLPELARGLGKSISEFKKAASEVEDSFKEAMDSTDPKKDEKVEKKETETKTEEKTEA
jgi:sec-independent protein translocase protein TatA